MDYEIVRPAFRHRLMIVHGDGLANSPDRDVIEVDPPFTAVPSLADAVIGFGG